MFRTTMKMVEVIWVSIWTAFTTAITCAYLSVDGARAFWEFDTALVVVFILLPLAALLLLPICFGWVISLGVLLIKARWRSATVVTFTPALAAIIPYAAYAVDVSPRFLLERPGLERAVEASTAARGGKFKEFEWDQTGFAGSGVTQQYMVFDASDELPKRVETDQTRWLSGSTTVKNMGHHFYLVIEHLS